jgi:hypothetical protein
MIVTTLIGIKNMPVKLSKMFKKLKSFSNLNNHLCSLDHLKKTSLLEIHILFQRKALLPSLVDTGRLDLHFPAVVQKFRDLPKLS